MTFRNLLLLLGLGSAFGPIPNSMAVQVVNIPFSSSADLNDPGIVDLSTLQNWNGVAAGESMFTVAADPLFPARSALQISSAALGVGSVTSNYGWTTLDVKLPQHVLHATNTVTVDFDVRYDAVFDASNGERNRTLVALVDNYPSTNPTYSSVTPDSPGYIAGTEPYGTPTYMLRIRPGDSNATSFLEYGGAVTRGATNYENTWEYSGNTWYPGYDAVPGPNGVESSPGQVPDYPLSGEVTTTPVFKGYTADQATAQVWEFKYVITPTEQDVYDRIINPALSSDQQTSSFNLLGSMSLPQTSTAPAYQYYEGFDAVRLFFNNNPGKGSGDYGVSDDSNTYLSNLTVDVTAVPEPSELLCALFAAILISAARRSSPARQKKSDRSSRIPHVCRIARL